MRTDIAALVVVSLTAALLTSVTPTLGEADSLLKAMNMTELWSHTEEYLVDLRKRNDTASNIINFRLWTDNGTWIGCRLQFRASGNDSHVGSVEFPKLGEYICDDGVYTMRTTLPGMVYEERVLLENPIQVELAADVPTYVSRLCVGLRGEIADSALGYRGFCINNQLLKECKRLTNNWKLITLHDQDTIVLSDKIRSVGRIIFRDIDSLVAGMERLARNRYDSDAKWAVCNRIDLIQGIDASKYSKLFCHAEKQNTRYQMSSYFNIPYITTEIKSELKDPNKCSPVEPIR